MSVQKRIEKFTYDAVAAACARALLDDSKTVKDKHVVRVAYKARGGSMPSQYFGVETNAYAAGNAGGTIMDTINFATGVARPALGPQMGGTAATTTFDHHIPSSKHIKSMIHEHGLRASGAAIDAIRAVVTDRVHQLATDIAKAKSVSKVLALKRYA